MKIRKLVVNHFKSIQDCTVHIKSDNLCLIGKNESGKTNILRGFEYLNYKKQFNSSDVNKNSADELGINFPTIYAKFEIDKNESNNIKSYVDQIIRMESLPKSEFDKQTFMYIDLLRWGNSPSEYNIILYNEKNSVAVLENIKDKRKLPKILKEFYDQFIPNIELFTEEELEMESASVQELKGRSKKHNSLRKLLLLCGCKDFELLNFDTQDHSAIAAKISRYTEQANKLFKQYYFQDKSIQLKLVYTGTKISFTISDETGNFYTVNERSPGLKYFLSFIINKHYTSHSRDKDSIILLDEPASNLHPQGARDFIEILPSLEMSQFIFTTHKPFLVLRNDLDNLILVKRSGKEGTKVNLKPYSNNYQVLRKELGILLNDSFLIGETNIIVEGATEKFALNLIFNEICKNSKETELEWLNIYNAGGVTEVKPSINYLANTLNLKGVVLLDSDKEADDFISTKKNKKATEILNGNSWNLIRVNDVFKDNLIRTFEDLFPQDLYLQAYNDYCKELEVLDTFDKPYENYIANDKINTPIIDELKKHYLTFFDVENQRSKSINKIHVMRLLFNSLEQSRWKTTFTHAFKLAKLIGASINKLKK